MARMAYNIDSIPREKWAGIIRRNSDLLVPARIRDRDVPGDVRHLADRVVGERIHNPNDHLCPIVESTQGWVCRKEIGDV